MDTEDDSTGDVSQSTGQRREAAKPQRPLLSPLRIILFVLLAVMIGALAVDQRARHASQGAFAALQKALGDEKNISKVKREEVHQLLGRQPEDDGEPNDVYEEYSWQGVPRKQTVFVVYWPGKEPTLKDVSLNAAPR